MARDRLDQPRRRQTLRTPEIDADAFGRLSERIARFLGTGRFLVYMTCVIVVWILWNGFGPAQLRWDPYPFIFLTLILSLQASYAAPLILLAQNRQDDRDRVNLEQDRAATERARADAEYLAREMAALRIAMGEVATRDYLRSELRELAESLVAPPSHDRGPDERHEPRRDGPRHGGTPPAGISSKDG
jgi:uncharacterized membrane protein